MQLSDLFVSHKQVDPVKFDRDEPTLPQPIYLNLDRAKKVTTDDTPDSEEDMSTWNADDDDDFSSWRVPELESSTTSSSASYSATTVSGNKRIVPRWSSVYAGKKDQWVADMTAAYKKAGLSDNAIKNLLAKNALESGWGKTAQGAYNFGNLTTGSSWRGKYVDGRDHDSNGQRISQKFRAYDSIDDYVADEIDFLTRLYDFNQNDDFDTFIGKLQGGNKGKRRYAADLKYSDKVRRVYNSI